MSQAHLCVVIGSSDPPAFTDLNTKTGQNAQL